MPHIASTLTCDNRYTDYVRGGDNRPVEEWSCTIKGGYGLANKNFITPAGAVLTEVSDEDLARLQKNVHFKDHLKGGFVKVYVKSAPDGEKAAADMQRGDKSQPLNPAMFADKNPDKPEQLSVATHA
jgi:hypothetical protein